MNAILSEVYGDMSAQVSRNREDRRKAQEDAKKAFWGSLQQGSSDAPAQPAQREEAPNVGVSKIKKSMFGSMFGSRSKASKSK